MAIGGENMTSLEQMAIDAAWQDCPHRRKAEEIDQTLQELLDEPTFLRPSTWPRIKRLMAMRRMHEDLAQAALRHVVLDVGQA